MKIDAKLNRIMFNTIYHPQFLPFFSSKIVMMGKKAHEYETHTKSDLSKARFLIRLIRMNKTKSNFPKKNPPCMGACLRACVCVFVSVTRTIRNNQVELENKEVEREKL